MNNYIYILYIIYERWFMIDDLWYIIIIYYILNFIYYILYIVNMRITGYLPKNVGFITYKHMLLLKLKTLHPLGFPMHPLIHVSTQAKM